MSKDKIRLNKNGSENILTEILPDGTVKIYNTFDGKVSVGIHAKGESHRDYSSSGRVVPLDNGLG